MVHQNSQIDFYVGLLSEMLTDNPLNLRSTSVQRDIVTLVSRSSSEGFGFLTKALPKLGKALDRGLTDTRFDVPSGFKSAKDMSIPAFMQEYFKRVFDCDGNLLAEADAASVAHIRQVCFSLYKLELAYKRSDEARVIESFVATERELQLSDDACTSEELVGASYIIRGALQNFDEEDIVPRHGPGAVATGERLDEKWVFSRFYRCIHSVYPYHQYFMVGGDREAIDRLDWLDSLEHRETGVAKVVLVPKDSRGPRLISCEPLEFQFVQQGLGRKLVRHLETSWVTGGRVNFTNQEINRKLALESSRTKEFATLDLKDASDRVSLKLVKQLFRHVPGLLRALEATRTVATRLPNGSTIRLAKFAPMGSALCFPVEALCFWAICVAAISRWARKRPSVIGKDVYVYGDDIIVKTEYAEVCMQALERAGLKVNRDKSCISGEFRESCGMDAFKGVCVTPLRAKTLWSRKRTDGAAYVSYSSFANQMADRGYIHTSYYVWKHLSKVYGGIPYGTKFASYPCHVIPDAQDAERLNTARFPKRWNGHLQRFEFLTKYVSTKKTEATASGWSRLLRNLLTGYADDRDPDVNVVPSSLRIKLGWSPVY